MLAFQLDITVLIYKSRAAAWRGGRGRAAGAAVSAACRYAGELCSINSAEMNEWSVNLHNLHIHHYVRGCSKHMMLFYPASQPEPDHGGTGGK